MKKRFILIGMLVLSGLFFQGCDSSSEPDYMPPEYDGQNDDVLERFQALQEDVTPQPEKEIASR